MEDLHFARTCRFATPTLFLQWPYWLDSWSWPWSCTKDGRLRLLLSDAACRNCSLWDLRAAGAQPLPFDTTQAILRE